MPRRMPDEKEKRGFLYDRQPVLAYERGRTIWYCSLRDAVQNGGYKLLNVEELKKLIKTGATAPDGYTTFDLPEEGMIYEGMEEEDERKALSEKTAQNKDFWQEWRNVLTEVKKLHGGTKFCKCEEITE